jgi:hypothetical protein
MMLGSRCAEFIMGTGAPGPAEFSPALPPEEPRIST